MGMIGGVFSMMGAMASADAMRSQGEAEKQAAYYNAAMKEQRAMQERAVEQRVALRKRRDTDMIQSTIQARAAASGGGASDPTVIDISGNVAQEGEYQALQSMWIGEQRGRDLENQAQLDRYVGEQKKKAAEKKADATILGGIGGMIGSIGKGFG
jgi:hypothetical protein